METQEIKQESNTEKILKNARESENISGGENPLIPEPKTPKKRGPKPKNKDAQESKGPEIKMPDIDSKVLCLPLCKVISNGAVQFAGHEAAGMTKNEMLSIAESLGLILDKYAPGILAKYGAEALLLLAVGQYGARVISIRSDVQKAKREYEEKLARDKGLQPEVDDLRS